MPNLTGSLQSIPLPALTRFLSGLGETGDLRIARGPWLGMMVFERGRVLSAEAVGLVGDDALEVLVQVLAGSEFAFEARAPGTPAMVDTIAAHGIDLTPTELQERLVALGSADSPLPALDPDAVPYVVAPASASAGSADAQLTLTRQALAVFLDVDGHRSIAEIAARRGLRSSLRSLARLQEQGLVGCAPPVPGGGGSWPGTQVATYPDASGDVPDAPPSSGQTRGTQSGWLRTRAMVRELSHVVAIIGVLTLAFHAVAGTFRVQGTSMEPTLNDGQFLLVNKGAYFRLGGPALASSSTASGAPGYLFGGPRRGDLVVFHAPPQPGTDYIKRIIGLPGDEVLISAGQVFVNGLPLNEPYLSSSAIATYTYPADGQALRIPADSYFVLGDNRRDSVDSHLGWLVPANDLIGKTWLTGWPTVGGVPWPVQSTATP